MELNTPNNEEQPPRQTPEDSSHDAQAQTARVVPATPQPDKNGPDTPDVADENTSIGRAEAETYVAQPPDNSEDQTVVGQPVENQDDDEATDPRVRAISPSEQAKSEESEVPEQETHTFREYGGSSAAAGSLNNTPYDTYEEHPTWSEHSGYGQEQAYPTEPAAHPAPTPPLPNAYSEQASGSGVNNPQKAYAPPPPPPASSGVNYSSGSFPPASSGVNYSSGSFPPASSGVNYPPPPPFNSGVNHPQNYNSGVYPPTPPMNSGVNHPQNYNSGVYPPTQSSGANYASGVLGAGYSPQADTTPFNPYANASGQFPPPAPKTPKPPKEPGKLARPLPLWGLILGLVLIVALMVILHLTGSDWAAGAAHAGTAAIILAFALLIALAVRAGNGLTSSLNPTRRRQIVVTLLCVLILFVQSGTELFLQNPLHSAQAHSFENQQKWQEAINEYGLAGQHAPDGEDQARVYVSWGQALSKAQNYSEAIKKFDIVISKYTDSSLKDEVKHAQDGNLTALFALTQNLVKAGDYDNAQKNYAAIMNLSYCDTSCKTKAQTGDLDARFTLADESMQRQDYTDAAVRYDAILALTYCDSACQDKGKGNAAKAYYNLAESSLKSKDYDTAVSKFDTILTNFPNTPEAKKLYGDMAKALMGQALAQRKSSCSSAIPTYQRLAKQFKNSSEGKKAQSDLNAPQTVKGTFSNTESYDFQQMGLTTGLKGNMGKDALFSKWDGAPYKVSIDSKGHFTFTGVKQGNYDLIWYSYTETSTMYYKYVEFMYHQTDLTPIYVAKVGPLCTVDMGTVTNSSYSY